MLFGGQEYEKKVLNEAFKFAEENEMKLVYGAMVGGISKGLQNFDSDYDTRFLYIKKDFPHKIYNPAEYKESVLIKRYYPEEEELYEWLPFWEATSFFSFLENPILDNKFSIGLFGVVLWTMMSPYTWDPYGLQNKLVPYINTFFPKHYAIKYYLDQLEVHMAMGNEENILVKEYLYAIHAVCSLQWVMRYKSMPPVYLRSLYLATEDNKVIEEIESVIEKMHKATEEIVAIPENVGKLHQTHTAALTQKNEIIDEHIDKIRKQSEVFLHECKQINDSSIEKIYQVLQLLDRSLHEKEVNGIKV